MHFIMPEEAEMPTFYFHSFPCWCSLFSLPKTQPLPNNVIPCINVYFLKAIALLFLLELPVLSVRHPF